MKVLHVEAGRYLYGGAQQVVWLNEGLARRGVENVLVCPDRSDIAAAVGDNACVYEVGMSGDLDVGVVPRLIRILKKEQPDIVHIHSRRGADIYGGLAARFMGIPAILSRRVDNRESRLLAPLKYALYCRVIVISKAIGSVLVSGGIDASKIETVRSAVDADAYNNEADNHWFETEFSLPSNAKTLGVIAQLIPRKGHKYLLNSLPKLLQAHPELQVLIFGQGPLKAELTNRVALTEFQGRVKMAGFRDDLARIFPNLYAVVHPAEREGLGVALLQASASGVPVVAARAGGIPEIVLDDVNGITFDIGDEPGLLGALDALLANQELRNTLGAGGRTLARSEFSIDAMVEGNLRVYQSVLGS
ncbi:MAG: glycosyltransferase family 4 protein [Luminiphilus sp.]|nr:glycosyltransferase family 4 protein [Luminiphilus sp.]